MDRLWIALGALSGLTGVAMAAAAAHALPNKLDAEQMTAIRAAVQMQGWHALALVAVGVLAARGSGSVLWSLSGAAFALGTVLFCGTVYATNLAGLRLGPLAPIGGTLLMAGWALLGLAAILRA